MQTPLKDPTFRQFDGELHLLYSELLRLARIVFDQFQLTLDSFQHQNLDLSHAANEMESQASCLKKRIDSAITDVLAQRGPVVRGLPVILAFSRLAADLEHMSNEIFRITPISTDIYSNVHSNPRSYLLHEASGMANLVNALLKEAIEMLEDLAQESAKKLLHNRNELNAEFQACLRRLATYVLEDARNTGHIFNIILNLKSLERIGDYAGNLAEYVVYITNCEVVRHTGNDQT